MKKAVKTVISIVLCIMMVMPTFSCMVSLAAAPGKVTGLKLQTNAATKQKLSWNRLTGATGYIIYKYDSADERYEQTGKTKSTSYTVSGLKEGITYRYRIKAYKLSGGKEQKGAYSATLTVTALGTPKGFKLSTCETTSLKLSWSKLKGAQGYDVYTYRSGEWKKLGSTKGTSYTDKSVSAGRDYSYRIRAYKKNGSTTSYSPYTSKHTVTAKPNTVGKVTISGLTSASVTISWSKVTGAGGYYLYRYDTAAKAYKRVADITATKYTFKGLKSASTERFLVKAYAKRYNTVYADNAKVVVVTAPDKVQSLDGKAENGGIKFTWGKVSRASGYQLYTYNVQTSKWTRAYSGTKNTYTLKNIPEGQAVQVKVRAYVSSGSSKYYGAFSSVYSSATEPKAPEKLTAVQNSDNGVTLTWEAVEGATGYQVYKYDVKKGDWSVLTVTTKTRYNDNEIDEKNTTTYTYRVRAYSTTSNTILYGEFAHASVDYVSSKPITDENILKSLIEDKGFVGYLYEPKGNYYYTAKDPWQRSLGFTAAYDMAAPFVIMWYNTIRIKFNYNNLDWMVQLWKGQYGWVFKGAEIGVYTKPMSRDLDFYDCASDEHLLNMSFDFYYNGKLRFSRPYGEYWWCTGFVPGTNYINHDRISMKIRITMIDYNMLNAFCKALEGQGYKPADYRVEGLDVYFTY